MPGALLELVDEGYEEIKVIGRGQYGKAHLVRHVQDQSFFIAKSIDLTCLSNKERETANQEVNLLSRLDHPNIVEYRDNFRKEETLIIIMQYCEGGDMQAYIKEKFKEKQRIREDQIMHYYVQVMQALQYIHSNRILHRDLKTSNLFLMRKKEVVKLGDFGISRVLEGSMEAAVTVVGTPYYMSPEVCENKPYTFKSDVWALGCVMYELCMLKHAFSADNLLGLVYKIVSDKYEQIPKLYSQELKILIQRMLEKDADKRPSIRDLLNDGYVHRFMNEFVQTRGQVAKPVARPGGGRGPNKVASASGGAGAPAEAPGAEAAPPGTAGGRAPRTPARPGPQRQERGATVRKAGGVAAGGGGASAAAPRRIETPKEAMDRRKREAAEKKGAAMTHAASKAQDNKMMAKQMQEREFYSTRLDRGMAVHRETPAMTGGTIGEETQLVQREESEEDVYSEEEFDDDYDDEEQYDDDFEDEDADDDSDEVDDPDSGAETQHVGPINSEYVAACVAREEADYDRVLVNYERNLSPVAEAAEAAASPAPRRTSPAPSPDRRVGAGGGGAPASTMQQRSGKLQDELVQKMGVQTFQTMYQYLLNARQTNMKESIVQQELKGLVGKDTYKKYGLDVDQLVFSQIMTGD